MIRQLGVFRVGRRRIVEEITRHRFLSQASELFGASLDYETTLRNISRLAVPSFADWSAVFLLEGTVLKCVALTHKDPEKEKLGYEYLRRFPPDADNPMSVFHLVHSSEAKLVRNAKPNWKTASTGDQERYSLLVKLNVLSYMVVPIRQAGAVFGLHFFASSDRRRKYRPVDLELAMELGRRSAVAIENARLYKATQEAIRIKDEVLAVVSHDLKNPVHSVLLNSNLISRIAKGELPRSYETIAKAAELIQLAAGHMSSLIQDLLHASKLKAGNLSIEKHIYPVRLLVSEALTIANPLLAEKEIKVEQVISPRLDGLLCDKTRILQVFNNILGNAVKFSPPHSKIKITARRQGNLAMFSVQDQGLGIPHEQLNSIFEPFWQGSRARTHGGSGLGLYIAKSLIERHGGRIWARVRPGGGTSIKFTVPGLSIEAHAGHDRAA